MTASLNIPTFVGVSLTPLTRALSLHAQGLPLPQGVTSYAQGPSLFLCLGNSSICLDSGLLKHLLKQLDSTSPQRINRFFEVVPRVLVACLEASRADHLQGILTDGCFAFSRLSGDNTSFTRPRRIARLAGLDLDKPGDIHLAYLALYLLTYMGYSYSKTPKSQRKHDVIKARKKGVHISGFIELLKQKETFKGADIDAGEHRGGVWRIARLHPKLLELFKTRFIQVPVSDLSLPLRAFNTTLAVKAQLACRQSDHIEIERDRLLRDSGLVQPHRKGGARVHRMLSRILDTLHQAKVFVHTLIERGAGSFIKLETPNLARTAPKDPQPGPPPPLGASKLAEQILKTFKNQEVIDYFFDLVRTIERSDRGANPLLASLGDSPRREKGCPALE